MKRIIIFDFDGVLADSVNVVYNMNKDAAKHMGKTLTMEEYLSCFEEHINKRLALLLSLSEKEKEDFVEYKASIFPKYYTPESVTLFPFAEELIKQVSQLGSLWIASSSPKELIEKVLDSKGLLNYFSLIIGQNTQPKNLVLSEALAGKETEKIYFITDTTGDIKETRLLNVPVQTLAVSWGFHSSSLLTSEHPSIVVEDYDEIMKFIQSY